MREALQQVKILNGRTQPVLFLCDDSHPYVVKFGRPGSTIRRLASEFLGTEILRWAGLPTPESTVVNVSDSLIESCTKSPTTTTALQYSSGFQFGSRLVGWNERATPFDYLPESHLSQIANIEAFAGALVFDLWSANKGARQAVFHRRSPQARYSVHFVGHSGCFSGEKWSLSEPTASPLYHPAVYRDITGWDSFDPFLSRMISMSPHALESIANRVPPDWYEGGRLSLDQLLEQLLEKRARLREMISALRANSRNLFPSWRPTVYMFQKSSRSIIPAVAQNEPVI